MSFILPSPVTSQICFRSVLILIRSPDFADKNTWVSTLNLCDESGSSSKNSENAFVASEVWGTGESIVFVEAMLLLDMLRSVMISMLGDEGSPSFVGSDDGIDPRGASFLTGD